MIDVKPILRAGVAVQAASLATSNLKLIKGKPSTKKMLKAGTTNLVGIPLLQAQSQMIGTL